MFYESLGKIVMKKLLPKPQIGLELFIKEVNYHQI